MEAKKESGSVQGWLKTHKRYVIGPVVAVVGAVLVAGAVYHAVNGDFKFRSTKNELNNVVDANDQLTQDNQYLQNQLDEAKNSWEFAPTDEQVVSLKSYMQGKQGKGMTFDSATFASGRLTMWFNTKSQGKDALVSMEIAAPGTPFKTEDVIKAVEEQAKLDDASLQPQVHLYSSNIEDFVRQDKDLAAGLAGAIAGANQKELDSNLGNAIADQIVGEGNMAVVQDPTVWYSFESSTPDENGNRTISMYVAKRDAKGNLYSEKAGQRDGVENSDQSVLSLVGDYAKKQGIDVNQVKNEVTAQRETEVE